MIDRAPRYLEVPDNWREILNSIRRWPEPRTGLAEATMLGAPLDVIVDDDHLILVDALGGVVACWEIKP